MRTYTEALEWVALMAPDSSLAALGVVAYIFNVDPVKVRDDYRPILYKRVGRK